MKRLLILMLAVTAMSNCKAQKIYTDTTGWTERNTTRGFLYSPGIWYTSNNEGDSVGEITFHGDTMTAVRNLLIYLLQQKEENDAASLILQRINLDNLQKAVFVNDRGFDWDLKNYKKVLAKNKRDLNKRFPRYTEYIR